MQLNQSVLPANTVMSLARATENAVISIPVLVSKTGQAKGREGKVTPHWHAVVTYSALLPLFDVHASLRSSTVAEMCKEIKVRPINALLTSSLRRSVIDNRVCRLGTCACCVT